MKEIRILPSQEGKGRVFSAYLLSYIAFGAVWANTNDSVRPLHMTLVGSENQLRPFVANLLLGRKAETTERRGNRFEILKSAKFQAAWQRYPEGSSVTLFSPESFRLDPGMVDPKGVSFCLAPSIDWLPSKPVSLDILGWVEKLNLPIPMEKIGSVVRLAPLFIAYLDRRTRCPLIPDEKFYVQVLAHALSQGLATWSTDADGSGWYNRGSYGQHANLRYTEYNVEQAGLVPGVAVSCQHTTLETFLAQQVELYFQLKNGMKEKSNAA